VCDITGELEVVSFRSKVFGNTRNLRIWLPPGYQEHSNLDRRYPVLYLTDGQELFDACAAAPGRGEWHIDETASRLIKERAVEPLIIVGIDVGTHHERANEYLPYPDDTLRPYVATVHGKRFPRFLFREVMPFVDRKYRTDRDSKHAGIGGASYGAGIALFTVLTHPGRFGRLLLESPSLYAHDDYLLKLARAAKRFPGKIFVGVGTVQEPVDDVKKLQDILKQKSLNSRVKVFAQPGAGHNTEAWSARFPEALTFLYGARK
jgi:enterochelin esterase-like enzyme